MKDLIKIQTKDGNNIISARELHQFLEVQTAFTHWCKRMFEYDFDKAQDYTEVVVKNDSNSNGGKKTLIDYALTLNTAKEIAMLQRSEKGKQARQYFIACEEALKQKELTSTHQLVAQTQQMLLSIDTLKSTQESLELRLEDMEGDLKVGQSNYQTVHAFYRGMGMTWDLTKEQKRLVEVDLCGYSELKKEIVITRTTKDKDIFVYLFKETVLRSFFETRKKQQAGISQQEYMELSSFCRKNLYYAEFSINISALTLSSDSLAVIPKSIQYLKDMRDLNFRNNKIMAIPAELCKLQNLEELHLDNNLLAILPSEIGKLENLRILNLAYNHLETLPVELANLMNLQELYLAYNRIQYIPTALFDFLEKHNYGNCSLIEQYIKSRK